MSTNDKPRVEIARFLLETKSVYINFAEGFELTSGKLSPVYVDCRRLISYPEIMQEITECFREIVTDDIGLDKVDIIAGGATAGIPFASFLAKVLRIPLIYVRTEPKGYGSHDQIEGVLEGKKRIVLVEDLITDGGSKLKFKEGIEKAGGILRHVLCVFEYKSQAAKLSKGRDTLKGKGVRLHTLVDWDLLLRVAVDGKYINRDEEEKIIEFLRS